MYQFSVPMPYTKEAIDKLCSINNQVEKSRIQTLYFSLPSNSCDFTGFENGRYIYQEVTDFNYWKPLIEYSLEKEFDFVYLLNFPKIFNHETDNIEQQLEKLNKLINNLRHTGCNKVRVCNPQLMGYINKNYPDIELYLSTLSQMQNIKQYENVFLMFNNIKEFVPVFDLNKNFKFLRNIKKKFPNIKIELMVNEGCISGCPYQAQHAELLNCKTVNNIDKLYCFSTLFFRNNCSKIMHKNLSNYFSRSNIIYPWEIEDYSKFGINKFKLVGRNNYEFTIGKYINYYKMYLLGLDNFKNIENTPIRLFNNYINNNLNFTARCKELKKFLPDISYFKKYGHLCASRCGVECLYCYKCAKKIQKVFEKKQEEQRKMNLPVCYFN